MARLDMRQGPDPWLTPQDLFSQSMSNLLSYAAVHGRAIPLGSIWITGP